MSDKLYVTNADGVIVGTYQEIVIDSHGLFVREKCKSKSIGFTFDNEDIYLEKTPSKN